MAILCRAIAKSGSRCKNPVLVGKQHCLFHDPDAGELRLLGSRTGGRNRANRTRAAKVLPPAFTSTELLAVLSGAIRKVEAGELEPGVVNAMSSAARAMNSIREMTEVEQRLAELEARAGSQNDRRFG
jgi:hypothetical protein